MWETIQFSIMSCFSPKFGFAGENIHKTMPLKRMKIHTTHRVRNSSKRNEKASRDWWATIDKRLKLKSLLFWSCKNLVDGGNSVWGNCNIKHKSTTKYKPGMIIIQIHSSWKRKSRDLITKLLTTFRNSCATCRRLAWCSLSLNKITANRRRSQ